MNQKKAFNSIFRAAGLLALLLTFPAVLAASWEPYTFAQPELYEFETNVPGQPSSGYILDIRDAGLVDEYGAALYEVLYTTRSLVTADDVGGSMMGFGGGGLMMAGLNSMYMMFLVPALSDMDLEVGERMSLMGMGRVTVTGIEEVAGQTGYALRLETKSGEEYELVSEWVINLDLPMPLVTRSYENGELATETVLVRYQRN
jgi:hypothetical protein